MAVFLVEVHGQWLKIYFAIQFNYICMYVCIISVNKYLVYDPRITRSLTVQCTKQMRNCVCTSKFNFKPPEAISHRVLANMSQFPRPQRCVIWMRITEIPFELVNKNHHTICRKCICFLAHLLIFSFTHQLDSWLIDSVQRRLQKPGHVSLMRRRGECMLILASTA